MFKFLFKLIIIVILLFGVSHYANYLITGTTPKININKPTLPDINISNLSESISDKFKTDKKETSVATKETYLYKWKDEKGVIHYTSEKPPEDANKIESIKLRNDTNVVPSVSENNTENKVSNENTITSEQAQLPSTNLPENVYSPEGIKHLFEQAKGIQNLMDSQFNQQENIINSN